MELNNLVTNLRNIGWEKYNINNKKWTEFYNMYSIYYPSPFLAFKQFTPNNCGIFYDILFLLNNQSQPCFSDFQNVKSIIAKSVWMKLL